MPRRRVKDAGKIGEEVRSKQTITAGWAAQILHTNLGVSLVSYSIKS